LFRHREATRDQSVPGEFIVPDSLTASDYTLVVRAAFGENDVRTGALETTMAVKDLCCSI
jgi:hypothetical protein